MKKKKKILAIMPGAMELGGVERSLIGLLDSFDYDQYDVDLFLYGHHGPLMKMIDSRVNILPEVRELAYIRESFMTKIYNRCIVSAALRLKDEVKVRLGGKADPDATWAQVMRICTKPLEKEYDLALSFFLPFDFLQEMVKAKVKLCWIHTDYSAENVDTQFLLEQFSKADIIVAVSEICRDTFCGRVPQLADRVIVMENILSATMVNRDAQAMDVAGEMPQKGVRLLSVGRYCTAKNFDNVPDICARLCGKGLDVYWYIIGFGEDEALIRAKIAEAGMEDRVILLGRKENPYPYIKACDLYVQPSRYEGKSVTVREAQMLGKPVVITRYPTAMSQLEDGIDGVIVPMDNKGCAEEIAKILRDPEGLGKIANNAKNRDYSNRDEVKKLYRFII